jgi:septal ring factor EnvC (AmiA/AmiB activator)
LSKKIFARLLIISWALNSNIFAAPQVHDSNSVNQSLLLVKRKIDILQNTMSSDTQKLDTEEIELRQIEKELGKHQKHLEYTNQDINNTQRKILDLTSKHDLLAHKIAAQKKLLALYLRHAYSINNQNKVKQFLSILDSNNILKNIRFYSVISQKQQQSITTIDGLIKQLQSVSNELTTELNSMVVKKERLLQITDQIAQEQQRRMKIMLALKNKITSEHQVLGTYHNEQKELYNIMQKINADVHDIAAQSSTAALKDTFHLPVQVPKANVKSYLNGLLIKAHRGELVHAIYPGQIIFADWMKDFGLVIIIRHANNYITVYAHNQSLLKEAGEWVAKNEVISTVGESGGQQSPGLYFELREKEKPINVSSWIS